MVTFSNWLAFQGMINMPIPSTRWLPTPNGSHNHCAYITVLIWILCSLSKWRLSFFLNDCIAPLKYVFLMYILIFTSNHIPLRSRCPINISALNSLITLGHNKFLKPTLILIVRVKVGHLNFEPMLNSRKNLMWVIQFVLKLIFNVLDGILHEDLGEGMGSWTHSNSSLTKNTV